LAFCCSVYSNAQTVDTTGNLIDNGQWTGVGAYAPDPNDCCSNPAGSQPLYDTSSDTIKFSYGQATVGQVIGINNALSGSGLQINGYIFQYDAKTTSENGGGSDPLTSSSYLKDGSGNTLLSTNYQHGIHDWQTFSVTKTLNNPYNISGGGTVGVEFSGYDQGYWAGLYGPQIRNVSLRLNYSVGEDPCVTDPLSSTSCPGYAQAYKDQQCSINPLYDTTCPGYAEAYFNQQCGYNPLYDAACPGNSAVITSGNLVPKPGSWFRESNQSFAINKALSHGGAGLQVHAFRWGFETFGLWSAGDFKSDVNIRDSNGDSIYSFSTGWQNVGGGYTDRSYYYQLPQSRNNLTLGTFEYNTEVSGLAAVGNFWARMLYTPDSCSLDPLSSPLCSKYQEAFLEQQCAIYTLYSAQCPGYAEALAKMLEEQQALLASTTSTTSTDPTSTNTGSTGTTSSAVGNTQDPTKTDATVTTDVGGVELSTTGEIVVADSVPSTVKEAAKESTKTPEESTKETKTTSTTEKKTTKVNAVALAMAAVRETEATARATAEAAVAQSQSAAANPEDGTGATVNIGGITLAQLRAVTTAGQEQASQAAANRATQQAVTATRLLSTDIETSTLMDDEKKENALVTGDVIQNTVNQTISINYSLLNKNEEDRFEDKNKNAGTGLSTTNISALPIVTQEPITPTGPSVRRGGSVDGMNGGNMSELSKQPLDFNQYLTAQIKDAQFYSSKDIYTGQKNVDNARALKGLGTDRLHEQMVQQQYGY